MILKTISISNYRSITSAKKIRLDRTTILIGPNNEGKSNILRALVLAMTILTRGRTVVLAGRTRRVYSVTGYQWDMDFPMGQQAKKPNGRTEIILEFDLDEHEYDEFKQEVKSNITGLLPLKVAIGKNDASISFHKKGKYTAAMSKKSDSIADFVSKRIEFEHIPAVRTAESANEIVNELVSRELALLERDESYKDAVNQIESIQLPLLEELSENIKATLKQFLPKVESVEIELSQELRMRAFRRGVSISVNDGTKTPLHYKGDGVQSLAALAMIRYASEKFGRGKSFVVAIEEPESHLHPKAIHELKGVIDHLGEKHQVIVTTHNPLFVDRRVLSSNIIVNKKKAQPARRIADIRDVLGVRASDNLRNAMMVLVVEGDDDAKSLNAIFGSKNQYLKNCIENGSLAIDSLAGGTNLGYKLSLLRDHICLYHVFLDHDACGKLAFDKARNAGLLEPGHICFAKAQGRNESEFEDLIDVELYKSAVQNKYFIDLSNPKFRGKKKWSERMKDVFLAFGKPWDDSIRNDLKHMVSLLVMGRPSNALAVLDINIIAGLISAIEKRMREKTDLK